MKYRNNKGREIKKLEERKMNNKHTKKSNLERED